MKTYNWPFDTDTQNQTPASRIMLRTGQLQRQACRIDLCDAFLMPTKIKELVALLRADGWQHAAAPDHLRRRLAFDGKSLCEATLNFRPRNSRPFLEKTRK